MDPADFTDDAPGELAKTTDGLWAFAPDPLPPRFDMGTATIKNCPPPTLRWEN